MKVAVLGAGLQGSCVALELAARGVSVDLYDQDSGCLTRASSHNEGKIHLGYVYANDASRQTARTMISGALVFARLLRKFIGEEPLPVSDPFFYLAHRESLLTHEQIEAHFRDCRQIAEELGEGATPDYLGCDYRIAPERLSDEECSGRFDRHMVSAAWRTQEVSIDSEALGRRVDARVKADDAIKGCWGRHVLGVIPAATDVGVCFREVGGEAEFCERYDHVVNTSWTSLLEINRTAGIAPPRSWLHRVKHYLRVKLPQGHTWDIPSSTIVLGAFGDVVKYQNGALYLSWYPSGMLGSSSQILPPEWPLRLSCEKNRELRISIFEALASLVPSLRNLPECLIASSQVKGGVIFAWGATDIDDPASGLHERYRIGPGSRGRFHWVDTGKLTMAPLFGEEMARRICGK